jgi:hypothetical protein
LALADFESSLKIRPKHASSLCGRGHAQVLLGRIPEALRDGELAVKLDAKGKQDVLVACIYARVAELVRVSRPQAGRARPEKRYEDRAAELVCQAVDRQPREDRAAYWNKHVEPEYSLSTIRRHPRVAALAKKIMPVPPSPSR